MTHGVMQVNKILFTCKQASSTLHFNVNKPYKFTYSTPNLEVHNGELTSLRGMGSPLKTPDLRGLFPEDLHQCWNAASLPMGFLHQNIENVVVTEVPKLMMDASELVLTLI